MPYSDRPRKHSSRVEGVCAACQRIRRVGVDGTFHRHDAPPGGTCAGSGNPLHAPGQGRRTVATYAFLHVEDRDGIVLAHMSPGRVRLRLLLIVGSTSSAGIVQLSLSPEHVRQIADDLGAWIRAARQVLDPLDATALATGTTAVAPDVTWLRILPAVRPVAVSRNAVITSRTGGRTRPQLALCAARGGPERPCGIAVLDLEQVGRLRDGLEGWLDWVAFLDATDLHHLDPEGAL